MKNIFSLASVFSALVLQFFAVSSAFAIDVKDVIAQLQAGGATLEVHGIDTSAYRYVVTFRAPPPNFFDYKHFALTSKDANLQKVISGLRRHDVILVKGDIPAPSRAFQHIEATEITLLKSPGENIGPNPHTVKVPDDLIGKTEMTVKAHAVDPEGRMLVVDYLGTVFPVTVPKARRTAVAALDRGDLITLKFEINADPQAPVHLGLVDAADALVVHENMTAMHATRVEYEGNLVMFPKSPQVMFNVFALQLELRDGNKRDYTIVNFKDPKLFMQMRDKIQEVWDISKIPAVNDRNKLVKKGLLIKANGTFNFVDKSQANPQILVDQLGDISFSEAP